MRHPSFMEINLGALIGTVVGAIGGLFAVGIAPAILFRDAAELFNTPILGTIFLVLAGCFGWLIGGQIGPRLEGLMGERNGNWVGGIIGGIIPVVAIAMWGWYIVTRE